MYRRPEELFRNATRAQNRRSTLLKITEDSSLCRARLLPAHPALPTHRRTALDQALRAQHGIAPQDHAWGQ